ncbi:MAG: exodeoxyribonuclease VII large subunit [Clostridia bacterium]|nr:exodeoxyribonuclease VII large subunit [Clostridia bacterium]
MNLPSITVSQLNTYVKKLFDTDLMFASVIISGEISNYSPHYKTGHLYFTLKDASSSLKAVMFAGQARRLRFQPENGMHVFAMGRVSVFERDGVYQLYVNELIPDGEGALTAAFRQLKQRLEEKGLFDPAHKKALPAYPKKIGIITSPGSAALQDMLNILGRRYPLAEIVLAGVTVQGQTAPLEMIGALRAFNERTDVDVLILGRGGGSAEDLWCFNDEGLAWAVYESHIPVISAVGHETDFTICDFVSDVRAPTPSAAAELAVPDAADLLRRIKTLSDGLNTAYMQKINAVRSQLRMLFAQRDFSDPGRFFVPDKLKIESLRLQLAAQTEKTMQQKRLQLEKNVTALEKLNPLRVLLRGYAMVETDAGVVQSVDALHIGETVWISLHDGSLTAQIREIKRRENDGPTHL